MQFLWFILSVIALISTAIKYKEVFLLEKTVVPVEHIITGTFCKNKGGSSIAIHFKDKEYFLQYGREKCYNTKVGDKIYLLYYSRKDYFYIPETTHLYKKYIYTAFLSLLFSTLPWSKWKKYMNKSNSHDN